MKRIAIILLILSASTAFAAETKSEFKDGVAHGCELGMKKKGNNDKDAKTFCGCFTDVLVKDMSDEEVKLALSGDKEVAQN